MDTSMVLDRDQPEEKAALFRPGGPWAQDIGDTEAVSWRLVQAAISLHIVGATDIRYKRGFQKFPHPQSLDYKMTFAQRVFMLELTVRFYKGAAHQIMMEKDLERHVIFPYHLLMAYCGMQQAMGNLDPAIQNMIKLGIGKRALPQRFTNPDGSFNAKAYADETVGVHKPQSPSPATMASPNLYVSPYHSAMVSLQAQAPGKSPILPSTRGDLGNFLRDQPDSSTLPLARRISPEDPMAILKSVMDESSNNASGPNPATDNGDAEPFESSAYVYDTNNDWAGLTQY